MSEPDTPKSIALQDIRAAIGLLTRLPITVDINCTQRRGAAQAWAYPLAGLAVAGITGFVAHLMLWLTLPVAIVAALVLAAAILITGAMHEDGLADSADGLWGGWDRARRLEIMKDSRIGTYGVLALGLSLLLRWSALVTILSAGNVWPALIIAAMLSRAAMTAVMHVLPNARAEGLAQSVGRPDRATALIAGASAIIATLLLAPGWIGALVIVTVIATLACVTIAKAKIGGQTGDILGATQQITEITAFVTIATLIT